MKTQFITNCDGGRPDGLDEDNDCTVCALANASGIGYPAAHILMEQAGRLPGEGSYIHLGLEEYAKEGFGSFFMVAKPSASITLSQFARLFPIGRYIVRYDVGYRSSYVVATVNGVIINNSDTERSKKRVRMAWKINPA